MRISSGRLVCGLCFVPVTVQHIFPNPPISQEDPLIQLGVLLGCCENCSVRYTLDVNYSKD